MRIPDGRLPQSAILVLVVAFLAIDAFIAFERLLRQLRAQLAQHALAQQPFVFGSKRRLELFDAQWRLSVQQRLSVFVVGR